jgi:butyrate kinase
VINVSKILVINPGSTSTKIALYNDEKAIFEKSIEHSPQELEKFEKISDQLEYREKLILDALEKEKYSLEDLDAIACRGGLIGPVESGTYLVDEAMVDALRNATVEHASNLAGLIGYSLAKKVGINAYITDPVSVDEMDDVARISGMKDIERKSFSHVLNIKAVARKAEFELGKKYTQMNLVVAHLGGGISISALRKGKIVDVNGANDEGPFSPERSGELPVGEVVKIAYSGKYSRRDLKKRYVGKGGLVAYLGTNDLREAMKMAETDESAMLIVKAMAYQIAKGIAEMWTVLNGNVDAIILTGGMSLNSKFVEMIKSYVPNLALILVIAGAYEMEALAMGALRVLRGEEKPKTIEMMKR